jgi:predicted ATPase
MRPSLAERSSAACSGLGLASAANLAGALTYTDRTGSPLAGPVRLPVGTTSLVGREEAIGEVAGLLTRPELVVAGIGRAVGTELGQTDAPLEALAERLGDDRWLLVLDNLEQVLDAALDLDGLLARCPGVAILAVFVDGWTVEAAAAVAGLDEDRALELSESLARHSLIQVDRRDHGLPSGPRSRMLETVREFMTERLAARPDLAEVGRRHADHYRGLAEQADRPLRAVDVLGAAGPPRRGRRLG